MSGAAYTPGPWAHSGAVRTVVGEISGTNDVWVGGIYPQPNSPYRGEVCSIQSCDHIGGISREEAAANARLIAAAPALVEALQLVRMSAGWQAMSAETRAIIDAALDLALNPIKSGGSL